MPNCTNKLALFGNTHEIQQLLAYVKGQDANGDESNFTFHRIIPMPRDIERGNITFEQMTKTKNWYSWSLDNWNTKWDCGEVSIQCEEDYVLVTFVTAWSPPHPVIERLSVVFPAVGIAHSFVDEGWGFAGDISYHRGMVVETFDAAKDTEEFADMMNFVLDYEDHGGDDE